MTEAHGRIPVSSAVFEGERFYFKRSNSARHEPQGQASAAVSLAESEASSGADQVSLLTARGARGVSIRALLRPPAHVYSGCPPASLDLHLCFEKQLL